MSQEEIPEEKQPTDDESKAAIIGKGGIIGKLKSKKVILIIVLVVLLLGGGGAYYFIKSKSAKIDPSHAASNDKSHAPAAAKQETTYYDLDEFIVNLDKGDKQPNFLKTSVSLQLSSAELATKIKLKIPVIRDAFQTYLRELRADDLRGAAGIFRLREELLLRVNMIMTPDKVEDILFKEILVQ
jgi:flagellar FliL protein